MISVRDILHAHNTIRSHIFRTPLRAAFLLNERTGAQIFLKLENWQVTGSFKPRGALNCLACLSDAERAHGIVTASAGNHAQGVGLAARIFGVAPATIFVPRTAPRAKLDKLRQYPIDLRLVGDTYDDAHQAAEKFARDTGATFISAYDDWRVVAGAGTLGLEILQDLPDLDAILVPVGGGGLIAGIAIVVKAIAPSVQVIGVQPTASPALRDSLRDKKCYEEYPAAPTICDGLAGGIGKIGFEVAQKFVDDVILVDEFETRAAIRALVETQQLVVEGSGAVGVAALLARKTNLLGRRVVVVLSGGNIDLALLTEILNQKFEI